jgi:hypothetical protein
MWHQMPASSGQLEPIVMVRPLQEHQPVNLADAIGAAEPALSECLTLYIPGKDKDGNPIDQTPWTGEALAILAQIGGRATILPPVEAAWLNQETGRLIQDSVALAYTHVDPEHFETSLGWLRGFLHRLGRETGQAEVAFEFANRLYKIRHFDRD